jgi:hypothetical protein
MQRYTDDDDSYLSWIAQHPDGFVVNTDRNPNPNYLVLHRSTCRTISGRPSRGSSWTADYTKICGGRPELESWARNEIRAELRPCRICE